MKIFYLTVILLTTFSLYLGAIPASPYLITFAQPDGSTFQAHIKGDENFSWIETKNKKVLIKSKISGFFEFAITEERSDNSLKLLPSGIPVIKRGQSSLRIEPDLPYVTREQLRKIWKRNITVKRNLKIRPAKSSPRKK